MTKKILNGSVYQQYLVCGKQNCKCRESDENKHGPYWYWSRKASGKTIIKKLSEKQAQKALEFIENNRLVLAELEVKRKEAEEYLLKL